MNVINETDIFDVVLDFSGYEPKWIHDNCQVLKDKVGVYIYISTDSVYEVSSVILSFESDRQMCVGGHHE